MNRFYKIILLTIAYILSARLSTLFDVSGEVAAIWLPSGIALAALWRYGLDLWPGIYLGAFIIDTFTGATLLGGLFTASGATTEVVGTVYFLKLFSVDRRLSHVSDVSWLLFFSGLFAALGVTIEVMGLRMTNYSFELGSSLSSWVNWWGGDLTGIMVTGSLFFLLDTSLNFKKDTKTILEAGLGGLITIVLSLFIFDRSASHSDVQMTYLVFPLLLWASLRFEQLGASACTLIICAIGTWKTIIGLGPFAMAKISTGLLHLQLYMAVCSVSSLVGAALGTQTRKAIKLRDEFFSLASHELKSPLTSIQLQTYLVRKMFRSGPETTSKINSTLDSAIVQVSRITNLVNDLLDVTKIESGRLALNLEKVNLHSVTESVVKRFLPQLEMAQCTVQIHIDKDIEGYWDPLRIEQIIVNLLTNSIKYAPGSPIEIAAEPLEDNINLVFQDFGPGIDHENQGRIFDRFERFGQANQIAGLGLGLFITKQIIEALKGKISVRSELGRGTRFTIDLPLRPAL